MPSSGTTYGSETLPTGAAKIAASLASSTWPLPIQPMSPPSAASALSELSRAASAKGRVPASMSAVSLSAHSASVGPCMTWITCQPNSVLTGSRSWPGWRPGLKIASAKPWASWSSVEKYGSLPPVVTAESSSLSARAIASNCDGSVLSFSQVALASSSAFAQAGSPSGRGVSGRGVSLGE